MHLLENVEIPQCPPTVPKSLHSVFLDQAYALGCMAGDLVYSSLIVLPYKHFLKPRVLDRRRDDFRPMVEIHLISTSFLANIR